MMKTNNTPYAGLYVHVPFCVRKCPYCDFYSITDLTLESDYVNALQKEMALRATAEIAFDSLYIGGGTPSVLSPSSIDRVIQSACRHYPVLSEAEITLEVNPGTVDKRKLREYRHIGINRLNIGVQSFQDEQLKMLGRIHSAADAKLVLSQAREAGFANLGLDLMYGLPGQTRECWLEDMETAARFQPEHLSCYLLTFEPGTPMDQQRRRGEIRPLQDDRTSRLFETTLQRLEALGYEQYEISNFAVRPVYRSRHNQKYWAFVPYMGFGPSAHSFATPATRSWNYRDVKRYIATLENGGLPCEAHERLSPEQRMMEMIYLGLRKIEGIDLATFRRLSGIDFSVQCDQVIAAMQREGYLRVWGHHCGLTRRGQLLLDSIAALLIEAVS